MTGETFARAVGRRRRPPVGQPPPADARQAMTCMASCTTRVPKGVFRYRSHEEANADRERWTVAAVVARAHHAR